LKSAGGSLLQTRREGETERQGRHHRMKKSPISFYARALFPF
jgi:hypothetical protein